LRRRHQKTAPRLEQYVADEEPDTDHQDEHCQRRQDLGNRAAALPVLRAGNVGDQVEFSRRDAEI
jgi:hypothetical protein